VVKLCTKIKLNKSNPADRQVQAKAYAMGRQISASARKSLEKIYGRECRV
jgi:hypothetical protein